MFSIKNSSPDSRTIAIIRNIEKKTVVLTVWFTEKKRGSILVDTFQEDTKKYLDYSKEEGFTIKKPNKYRFEMTPHSRFTTDFPRFLNYYLAESNSGKSYNIAQLCQKYLEAFPKNEIIYVSANPVINDKNYVSIRKSIKEVDVGMMTAPINHLEFNDALFVFDDCDSGFDLKMEELDERLTDETVKELSITQRNKVRTMYNNKRKDIEKFVNDSIVNIMNNGRKNNLSMCCVCHKKNDGIFQMRILSEATGVIIFPYGGPREQTQTFLTKKLPFSKEQAKEIMDFEWYQYDYLFVNTSGSPFIITPDRLKRYF